MLINSAETRLCASGYLSLLMSSASVLIKQILQNPAKMIIITKHHKTNSYYKLSHKLTCYMLNCAKLDESLLTASKMSLNFEKVSCTQANKMFIAYAQCCRQQRCKFAAQEACRRQFYQWRQQGLGQHRCQGVFTMGDEL